MAIYHLHLKNISRSGGHSAVASAAYRAGETLPNEQEEAESAFGGRRDVRYAEIRLPIGAPAWMGDRAALWNAVEVAEKRADARLAKEIEFSIPRPLPRPMWLEVAREMADEYTARGHVVDLAIHDDDTAHNPHAHLMLTTRAIAGDGFGPKIREADGLAFVRDARARWERIANAALAKVGSAVTIDARSYAARGIAKTPGQHRGPDPKARREKRREAQRMSGPVHHDILEARRELLADSETRGHFPLLAARADWPPESREPPGGLSLAERDEFRTFWREVDRRCFGAEERKPEVSRPEERERASAWAELKATLHELRQSELPPSALEWDRVEEAVFRCEAEFAIAREETAEDRRLADAWRRHEAEQERLLPVPDPNGNPVPAAEREQAEERMLDEMHGPAPREPEVGGGDRHAAEEAIQRQARIEVSDREALAYRLAPQEDRLDWLSDRTPVEPAVTLERESADDRLDWLREQPGPQRDADEPERDRQRR